MSEAAMPTSLKELDKIALGWMEFTPPEAIEENHLLQTYRLRQNFCKDRVCRRNCRGNPFCLNYLGEARIKDQLNNHKDDTLNLPRRVKGKFVGLKNLGATCYANSLLQLWFHNKTFRDAILSWSPADDPKEQSNSSLYSDELFTPQTFVGHLQQLFSLMRYTNCSYIDPSPLIKSLRLDPATQQDAQEFSKLFITSLETELLHQSVPDVRDLISNHFRGEYAYVTRCCKCLKESVNPSTFYELNLNVKGHSTLSECLSECLQEERLEGANCYSCPTCQSKQEALRFMRIRSLPPVLNLQLLRLCYDREKNQRKKLKTDVQFPEVLDLKDFVFGSSKPIVYNLSGVLIHKGASASSGHYIAYIKDAASGVWNTFNDESVETLKEMKLQLDEDDIETAKKQKARAMKGFQRSTDAYMLVYTSENHKTSETEVLLPAKLQQYVDSKNQVFDEFCEQVELTKIEDIEKQKEILDVFNCLPVNDTEQLQDIEAISAEWLSSWLDVKKGDPKPIDNSNLLCPHNLLEPNMVTHFKYIASTTADQLYTKFGGGPRLRMDKALCQQCVTNQCVNNRIKNDSSNENKEIQNLLKRRMGLDEPGYYVDKRSLKTWRSQVLKMIESSSSSTNKPKNNAESPIVNGTTNDHTEKESLQKVSELVSVNERSLVVNNVEINAKRKKTDCKNNPNPRLLASRLKSSKISSTIPRRRNTSITVPYNTIEDCFVLVKRLETLETRPNTTNVSKDHRLSEQKRNLCRQLRVKLMRLRVSPKSAKAIYKFKRRSTEENDKNCNFQTKSSPEKETNHNKNGDESPLNNHLEERELNNQDEDKKYRITDEQDGKSDDGVPLAQLKAFNEGVLCLHGNLTIEESERRLVPVQVWQIFKKYFPSAPEFSNETEPCQQCQMDALKDDVVKQQYFEAAINQKKVLADLFNLKNRPVPGKSENTIYVLSKQHFHLRWCSFIRSATRRDNNSMVEPPHSLQIDLLLCHHGLFHYSLQYTEDLDRMVLVTAAEWESLKEHYLTDHAVTVNPDLTTNPRMCESCFTERLEEEQKEKLTYEKAKLHIRMVPSAAAVVVSESEADDANEAGRKRQRTDDGSKSPIPPELMKVMKEAAASSSAAAGDVRRSSRRKKAPGQKDVTLTVSSSLTLRELKQKITGHLAVAPFDQHLYTIGGLKLEGEFQTLADLAILPNSTLLLQIDEAKDFDDMLEESIPSSEPEAGFKGTGLLLA